MAAAMNLFNKNMFYPEAESGDLEAAEQRNPFE